MYFLKTSLQTAFPTKGLRGSPHCSITSIDNGEGKAYLVSMFAWGRKACPHQMVRQIVAHLPTAGKHVFARWRFPSCRLYCWESRMAIAKMIAVGNGSDKLELIRVLSRQNWPWTMTITIIEWFAHILHNYELPRTYMSMVFSSCLWCFGYSILSIVPFCVGSRLQSTFYITIHHFQLSLTICMHPPSIPIS